MNDLKVPKERVEAVLWMDGGRRATGNFFVSCGEGGRPPESGLAALLEDAGDLFVPFLPEGGVAAELINKGAVRAVELKGLASGGQGLEQRQDVVVSMADGEEIEGVLTAEVPAERSRLSDCLNAAGLFLRVERAGSVLYLNKAMVLKVSGRGRQA